MADHFLSLTSSYRWLYLIAYWLLIVGLIGICGLLFSQNQKQAQMDQKNLERLGILPGTVTREQFYQILQDEQKKAEEQKILEDDILLAAKPDQ